MARVDADYAKCEGHGLCEMTAPDIYQLDEDGKLRVLFAELPDHLVVAASAGARVCPVAALRLIE